MSTRIEKTLTVASPAGIPYDHAGVLMHRLSGLDAMIRVFPRNLPDGFEIASKRLPSYSWIREFHRARLMQGDTVRMAAIGPDGELIIEEAEYFFAFEGVSVEDRCIYVERGPRGRWTDFPDTRRLEMMGWSARAQLEVAIDDVAGR